MSAGTVVFVGSVLTRFTLWHRALTELTKASGDGSVTIEKFKEFCKTHQVLLARPFAVQDKLRLYTLGEGCWEKVALRRIEVRPGLTVKLCDLMTLVSGRRVLCCVCLGFSLYDPCLLYQCAAF